VGDGLLAVGAALDSDAEERALVERTKRLGHMKVEDLAVDDDLRNRAARAEEQREIDLLLAQLTKRQIDLLLGA
jgi:hypothetical protein